ncbi:hypothetical protein BD414DRAFT_539335 [Trametes punicea]|nr:hypothetical protein BD414DRAFT_539335 [Trametes punicea]
MAGRGTRGYVALDCETKRFVWLKDAWRVHYELVEKEGTILAQLNEKKVRNVPTLVCHGDIRNQTTKSPSVWEQKNPPKSASAPPLLLSSPFSSSSKTLVNNQAAPPSTPRKRSHSEVASTDTIDFREECPLRRHMHYRIVVREVALPLSEFQNGRQLVWIILDCVRAHKDAMLKANHIHRDVSSGNVLIYPRIVYSATDNALQVRWTGLLADWEMSKSVKDNEELLRPRQPPRTGTWQFLSVGMLSRHAKRVEIPDELESFMHVLLYYSVRYLHSNCQDVAEYIESFFESYTLHDDIYTCGLKKLTSVKTCGRLELKDDSPLKFHSPLDTVFKRLLPWFKAHYKVQAYQTKESEIPSPSRGNETSIQSFLAPLSSTPDELDVVDDLDPSVVSDSDDEEVPEGPPRPTPKEEKRAACVASHKSMVGVLSQAIHSTRWPAGDKVGDRVPHDYQPKYPVGQVQGASSRTVKRRKVMSMFDYQTCHSSLPARAVKSGLPRNLGVRR